MTRVVMKTKLLVILLTAALASNSLALTITETFDGLSIPSGWNAYIGDSSTSAYVREDGYLQTSFVRNTANDGIAKIWTDIGDIYPAGATAGSLTKSWIQFDVKSISGNSMTNLWFGLFNSTGDTDNNPALYSFAGASVGGNATSIKVISMNSGDVTYNGSTTAVRVKQRIYNLNSSTTAIETYVYAIDSEGNQGTQLASHAARTVLGSSASLATKMDSFGIRNLATSTTAVSTFLVDNFYFSTEGAFAGTMPAAFVTPEPVTIAMVSMGGLLFIRRRK